MRLDAFTPRSMPTLTAPVTCTAAVLLLQFQPLPAVEAVRAVTVDQDAVTGSTCPSVIDNTGYGAAPVQQVRVPGATTVMVAETCNNAVVALLAPVTVASRADAVVRRVPTPATTPLPGTVPLHHGRHRTVRRGPHRSWCCR